MKLFLILSSLIFFVPSDNKSNQQKLLFCSEYYNPHQQLFLKQNKLENAFVVYQDKILTKTGEIDKQRFKESIITTIPNKFQTGFAVLDVEDRNYYIVSGLIKVSEEKYTQALKEFLTKYIEILRYAKTVRPLLKWSFFDLPPAIYSERPISFTRMTNDIMPLLKEIDFFTTALYMTSSYTQKEKEYFLKSNLLNSLALSNLMDKPIYPFVWHRYGLNNKVNAMKKIEIDYFKKYIATILNVEYNNIKVNGVIWWNGESGGYAKRNKFPVLQEEYRGIKNYSEYQSKILQSYLVSIKFFF